ncbi:cation:proton antiporter [Halioxenophilus sp. WMMB6]|uniref:cation:proton antiporter n=1 Tax=Halioxenophilus sp. WMMB6 TaxID=3073815 RepID=UPI00295ECBEE|nr:cation:proton antiporter [Halioxenophilus sp. WMMB6]
MTEYAQLLVAIGLFFLLGLSADAIARKTAIPRVTLLVVIGILVGPQGFDWVPEPVRLQFDWLASVALVMIGFLLGGSLNSDTFIRHGASLFWVSISEALVTTLLVSFGLFVTGVDWQLAIILGCIAAATAAEVAFDAVVENRVNSPFSRLLLAIVAMDDVWGLLLFSVGVTLVAAMASSTESGALMIAMRELGGGIGLGFALGLPAAYLTGRLKPGEPILLEALCLVFLCSGLALWLEVSFLLAAIVMGATIANVARHHDRPFHAIENIEWPFLLLFFTLAGAQLEFDALLAVGFTAAIYVACRCLGKWAGAYLGATIAHLPTLTRRWIGFGLFPQAGAAIGMALVAAIHFPQYQQPLLQIVIATTVVFEVLGPIFTARALRATA